MKFTANLHRVLVTLAQVLSGVGALLILEENNALGVSDQAAAYVIFGANVVTVLATSLRANWLPGITSGVGVE